MADEVENLAGDLEKKYNEILKDSESKDNYVDDAYEQEEEEYKFEDVDDDKDKKDSESDEGGETEEEVKDEKEEEEDIEKDIESMSDEEIDELIEKHGEEQKITIPPEYVEAGYAAGFTDEKIKKLHEESPEVLSAMAHYRKQLLESQVSVKEEKKQEPPKPVKLEPISFDDVDLSDVDANTVKIINKIIEDRNNTAEKFNQVSEELTGLKSRSVSEEQRRANEFDAFIDGFFDKKSKDCPSLGQSARMNDAEKAVRKEVYSIAVSLQQVNGGSIEGNLEKAVKAYNGIYGKSESVAETKLKEKLNKRKKKFTPRPGGQKTEKKYKDDNEKGMAAMDKKGRELGLWD